MCAALLCAVGTATAESGERPVIGRSEKVWIKDADTILTARIDTGTRTSSLHAEALSYFRKEGKNWVRFTFRDDTGSAYTLTRPIKRFGNFKNNGVGDDVRPVVTLGLCIGTIYRRTQVNLVNRGDFNYSLLIGRRYLSNLLLVDTGKRLTHQPACRNTAGVLKNRGVPCVHSGKGS
ncbi:MAG: hypothetical protein ACI82H_002273 [Alphaproteobacteria bacterium]|jgi:hypothetical protein